MIAVPLTVIAPESLRTWYDQFADPDASVCHLDEHHQLSPDVVDDLVGRAAGGAVTFLSGHDSLVRDRKLADALRGRGVPASAQSEAAIQAARDKVILKRHLDARGIPTPSWSAHVPSDAVDGLLKRRDGTQSQGLTWADGGEADPDHYWERFVPGTEYSVIIHRQASRNQVYPPVWKGSTRRDLLPPWRRLRVCPMPEPSAALEAVLVDVAVELVDALDIEGFAEVEFVVDHRGTPLVLEINPRICGTLRIVAMATGTRIFDPRVRQMAGTRPSACRYAAEVPYDGPSLVSDDVVATSRLTAAAATPAQTRKLLERHVGNGTVEGWPAPW